MANVFQLIKSIDNLDYEYNQNKFTKEDFLKTKTELVEEFKAVVKTIGIDNVISSVHGYTHWYKDSAFDFIVSKMHNKIKEKEGVSGLSEAYKYLVNELVNTKGVAVFYDYLNKAINAKNSLDSEGVNQKDFITYEFYKDAWLARHPGQDEMANIMFKYLLDSKYGRDLSEIPPGVDKILLQTNLKEYSDQVIGSNPGEGKFVAKLISTLQSKSQVNPNQTSAVVDDFPTVLNKDSTVQALGEKEESGGDSQ